MPSPPYPSQPVTPSPFDDPRVRGLETTDPDVAHEAMRRTFRMRELVPGDAHDFYYRRAVSGEHRFAVGEMRYTGTLRAESEPLPFFGICRLLGGGFRVQAGDADHRAELLKPFAFPTTTNKRTEWDDVHIAQLMLDRAAVEAELVGLSLTAPPAGLHVIGMEPQSEALGRYWRGHMRHLYQDVVRNDAAMASPLIRGQAFRSLVAAFVTTFPTTAVGTSEASSARPVPSTVRRALAYVEEHAHDDIGVVEIAEAARLTPRGLQLAFRRHLDTTPMAVLRAARLRGAHHDLQVADPTRGHTVAGIAQSWGFANAGRFTAAYVAHYGRSPRETLES
jgi:AraC-like DNA-binding protein